MKSIPVFLGETDYKFVIICSVSNITFEIFKSFKDASKKAAWMSSYHSRPFEVAKINPMTVTERA